MAKELAERFTADGIDLARVTFERRGDLRYVGQGYELRVPFPDGTIDAAALAKAFDAFHEIHHREYGHHFADQAIEIVNLRLVGAASAATIAKPSVGKATSLDAAKVRDRHLHLPRRRQARRLSDDLLSPRPAAGRRAHRRARHRAADGFARRSCRLSTVSKPSRAAI